MELEGGVGALQADVVGGQLQRVVPVDPDPERLLAQPPQAVVEGLVAGRVRDGGEVEVLGAQGGQDPDHGDPAAVPGGGPAHDPEGLVQLAGERGEGPADQRRRGEVELQVEAVDLQDDPGVGRLGPDHLVQRQGAALAVDQEQLQLGPDGGRAGPEAGTLQQPFQGDQAILQPLLEAPVVPRIEPLAIDRQAHRMPPFGQRERPRLRRGETLLDAMLAGSGGPAKDPIALDVTADRLYVQGGLVRDGVAPDRLDDQTMMRNGSMCVSLRWPRQAEPGSFDRTRAGRPGVASAHESQPSPGDHATRGAAGPPHRSWIRCR